MSKITKQIIVNRFLSNIQEDIYIIFKEGKLIFKYDRLKYIDDEYTYDELMSIIYNEESDWTYLDNLDKAKIIINKEGEVVMENCSGTEFDINELSESEMEFVNESF